MRSFLAGAVTTLSLAVLLAPESVVAKTSLPEIRSSAANFVPRCATPDRLMTFLKSRNPDLDPRYRDIADWYRHWGEVWRVRWDYAFFQMALETNFLTYLRPDGRRGDVDPLQNNFAGIGTTGGGVPGDRYPDVKTGVLAQIQHLVVYSGERLETPIAPRTQLKQDDILSASLKLKRSVRYSDLARRWAVDPKYGASIAWVASEFRAKHCQGADALAPQEAQPLPSRDVRAPSSSPVVKPAQVVAETVAPTAPVPGKLASIAPPKPATRLSESGGKLTSRLETSNETLPEVANGDRACRISVASYGGQKNVLIRADEDGALHLAALTVLDGFEDSMTARFIQSRMPGGKPVGWFTDQQSALDAARTICGG
ncbi:MAG: glucosaminidase domain-containing protein [Hyphomicrobium sp.]|nr:glucosaminidase domain-containing protein [Hyphomicrobium sp.]